MSSFSRSSKGNSYRKGHYGSKHYQRRGFLGDLFTMFGSRSSRDYPVHEHPDYYQDQRNRDLTNQMISCQKCNAQLPIGSKFCSMCGEKILEALYCISCGEKLASEAKFCSKCGTKTNN